MSPSYLDSIVQLHCRVTLVEKLAKLAKIQIKQGGEGFFDSWKLNKIILASRDPTDNTNGEGPKESDPDAQVFNFDKWIKSNKVYDCGPE